MFALKNKKKILEVETLFRARNPKDAKMSRTIM